MATDQITDKNILKSWFKRGLKPLEAQFHAWMDSYWHKDDKIPVASVNNLADVLNKKAESKSLEAHVQDMTIHKTQSEQQKLDNLADNPGATYATKDDISNFVKKEYNTLLIDLSLIPEGGTISDEAVKNSVIAQCSEMTNINKPFELFLIDKDEVIFRPDGVSYDVFETDEVIMNTISVNIPEELTETLKGNKLSVNYIQKRAGEIIRVSIHATTVPDTAIIYLTDNNDGYISLDESSWKLLDEELLKGKHPVVYLKSKYSGTYCPATYNHAPEDDSLSFVEISYFKMNEGKRELWIERREFINKGGFWANIYEIDEETSECPIIKLPVPVSKDAIIIPVDFTNPELDIEASIKEFIQPFIDDGSFWSKPVYANYIWKTSYTEGVTAEDRSVIIPSEVYQDNVYWGYRFAQRVEILDALNNKIGIYELLIRKNVLSKVSIEIRDLEYNTDRTIFLFENGDGAISRADHDASMGILPKNWNEFYKALTHKLTPAIYLKTNNTDEYVPAKYKFSPNAEKTNFEGVISIEFIKEGQIWMESKKFTIDNNGGFKGSGSRMETIIQKIPVGGTNVHLVTDYPEDLSAYPDGSIFIKQQAAS